MIGTLDPQVKICCISSTTEAQMAISHGANAIGLVSHMPSGPGIIKDEKIREILDFTPDDFPTFLLTSHTTAKDITQQHQSLPAHTLQIVDQVEIDSYGRIRESLPDITIVQVVHVLNKYSVDQAISLSRYVDAILLDSGDPHRETKILGGTGKVHNWDLSKIIREEINIPLYLAGGLNSTNVVDAINLVQPYGIDLCSGVRTHDSLDESKLTDFFSAIKNNSPQL